MITNMQAAILQHTISGAANGHYCGDSPEMQSLVALGFMRSLGRKAFVPDEYFGITTQGRSALAEWREAQPKPIAPKRRKASRAFQLWESHRSAGCDLGFSEFLREVWPYQKHH